MTKDQFSQMIATRLGCDKEESKKHVEAFMATAIEVNAAGENIYLRGFGTFLIKRRRPKIARNISKNEPLKLAAKNIPFFKAAEVYKEVIKKSKKIRLTT